ncbi:RING finger protein 227-like [Spea bombifrons]|uniref:RING finger protein 227-like n=1 Tax=Spea bombifrons TaxID=233779 RepID=UPI002349CE30|nr:RING finger protein 227-like [Spea bombifrons]
MSHLPEVNMEECGICYQDYGPGRRPRPLASCRHAVCECCLQRLGAKGGTIACPFCRAHSPLPSDEEDGASDVREKGTGPRGWLKRLCRKSRASFRRQGSLTKEDIRDMALMSSYFL